jgi:hypothetical protein
MTTTRTWLTGVISLLAVTAACGSPSDAPTARPDVAAPVAPPTSTTSTPTNCYDTGIYAGTGACHAGGELVTVGQVLDPATVQLTDGRRVRLLGVVAPDPGSCAAAYATTYTQSKVAGQVLNLYLEPGSAQDAFGSFWGYLQYGPGYGTDLGYGLARLGWAAAYAQSPANAAYLGNVSTATALAASQHTGQFGPPCGPPIPPPPTAVIPPPRASEPVVNLPDPPDVTYEAPAPRVEKRHTGHSGHPCMSGERDGDHDGYCGEGR